MVEIDDAGYQWKKYANTLRLVRIPSISGSITTACLLIEWVTCENSNGLTLAV